VAYIDLDSMDSSSSNRPSAWVKWDNRIDAKEKSRETKQLYQADCSARQLRSVHWIDYDASGRVMASGPQYASTLDFKPVVPDSIGESIFEVLCTPALDATTGADANAVG
jgi:hypothetical protein